MSGETEQRLKQLSPVKRAYFVLEKLKKQVQTLEKAQKEPIAIVGMGCRLPGGVKDAVSYWSLLKGGVDAIGPIPADRWDVDDYFDPEQKTPGKVYVREGGYLETAAISGFDPTFFGITPREAVSMDPQQRLLLEVMWEAIEDAGIIPDNLRDSLTGVYVAMMFNDYYQYMLKFGSDKDIDIYSSTGNDFGVAAGRLSYVLGLQGPCIAVNTTCSSSLVTIHMAVQALRAGECDLAAAGGVNVLMAPEMYISLSDGGALAPDCRCKSFDAGANGYVRGEGCGIFILKRLSDAERDGDHIHALIRGSAVNHDGRASGLTVPNGRAQEALIRTALKNARVEPSEIDYVECHGTGTPLGDPIEYNALKAVLSKGRDKEHPLTIGSVKTNIGHLETAAGVAGAVKTVLALQHELIPKILNFNKVNPNIDLERLPARIADRPIAWPANGRARRAGVSSFGLSGTNAHVILEEAPAAEKILHPDEPGRVHLLPISARTPEALRELASRYHKLLSDAEYASQVDLVDLCYTASLRRKHHNFRLSVAFHDLQQLTDSMGAFSRGEERSGMFMAESVEGKPGKLVFVSSGQGPRFWPIAQELLDEPVFRDTMERCDATLKKIAGWSLLEKLQADESVSEMDRTEFTQPGLCSIQISLFELWKSCGVIPDAVVGHSMGEVPAAYMAGALSLEDALLVIYHRGRLIQTLTGGRGKMAFVDLPRSETEAFLAGYEGRLSVAAINSPGNTVISGEAQALQEVVAAMQAKEVFVRVLESVDFASHSPQMADIQGDLSASVASIAPRATAIPFYSTVASEPLAGEKLGAAYWAENIRQPVLFSTVVEKLLEGGHNIFLEIAPHPALSGSVSQCIAASGKKAQAIPSLRRDVEDKKLMLLGAHGALHCAGLKIDWNRFFPEGGNLVSLPAYAWQRNRYWINIDPHKQIVPPSSGKEEKGPGEWLYEPVWEREDLVRGEDSLAEAGTAIVFADREGFAADMVGMLQRHKLNCITVFPGKKFENNGNSFIIRPDRRQDFETLFQEFTREGQPPLRGLLHFWSLDAPLPEKITIENIESSSRLILGSLLYTIQTAARSATPARLWIFTKGVHYPEGSGIPMVSQSPVWGLGRVIEKEHPEIWGGLIDLDSKPESLQAAGEEVLYSNREDQIVFRSGKRFVARLKSLSISEATGEFRFSAEGSYLITGGLGSIGVELAKWMIQKGAKKLALPGRTKLPHRSTWHQEHEPRIAQRIKSIQELEKLGAEINVESVDISSESDMIDYIDRLERNGWLPIKGIIHSAAVLDSRPLVNLDPQAIGPALQPKIQGAWLLHKLVDQNTLDFFVEFSSLASVLGDFAEFAGMYPAGNAFDDSLAHFRRMRGLKAISINWGFWKETEFGESAEGKGLLRKLRSRGIGAFSPVQAFEVLESLLKKGNHAPAQILCTPVEWQIFRKSGVSERERFYFNNQLSLFESDDETGDDDSAMRLTLQKLGEAPAEQRIGLLRDYLRESVAAVMRLSPDQVDETIPVKSLGVDSIMALELRKKINKDIGLNLPVVKVLDGSSIVEIAKNLVGSMPAMAGRSKKSPGKKGPEILPLSENQKGLWFLNKLSPRSTAYNINVAAQIISEIEIDALRNAFQTLIERYAILRANFLEDNGRPFQIIHERLDADFEVVDASEWNQREITEAQNREITHNFVLDSEPLLRLRLFSQSSYAHILILTSNRILLDDTSLRILWNELMMLYEAKRLNNPANLPKIGKVFADYIAEEAHFLSGTDSTDLERFWAIQLQGPLQMLEPPADGLRAPIRTYQGATFRSQIPREIAASLQKLNDRTERFAYLLASFLLLIFRSTENEDILIGLPASLRNIAGFDEAIGNFTNPVVLRFQVNGEMKFSELVAYTRQRIVEALANRRMPFPRLVQKIQPLRYPARSPLFQIMFDMDIEHREPEQLIGSLSANWIDLEADESQYELFVKFTEREDGITIKIKYKEDFYNRVAVEQSFLRYVTIMKSLQANPTQKLSQVRYKSELEEQQLIEWNRTEYEIVPECLHERFVNMVGEVPGAVAAEYSGKSRTYRDLHYLSDRLAGALARDGVVPGDRVAFCMTRTPDLLVVLLGIMKAGGVCVPLDPVLSAPRLLTYLKNSGARCLITQEIFHSRFLAQESEENFKLLLFEHFDFKKQSQPLRIELNPQSAAIILYTFRDEVLPIGIVLSHVALQNSIGWHVRNSSLGIGSRTLQINSVNSTPFWQEVFSTISSGGTLVFTTRKVLLNNLTFAEWLIDKNIERAFIPPEVLESLADLASDQEIMPAYLRELIIVGERAFISQNIVHFLERVPGCQLFYHFGFLECPIMAGFVLEDLTMGWPNHMPIGRSIDNTKTLILNSTATEYVATGLEGDLYIDSLSLADGYFGADRQDQTDACFIPHPFEKNSGRKVFKTNYRGRYLRDGNITLVGPTDPSRRVKIRGVTINLEEIETALEQHPAIRKSYVLRHDDVGDNGLLAYIVSDQIVDRMVMLIKCEVEYNGKKELLITQDISSTGLSLQGIPADWTKGIEVKLNLTLPGGENSLQLDGIVAWLDGTRAGIRFKEIKAPDKALLKVTLTRIIEVEQMSLANSSQTEFRVPIRRHCRAIISDGPPVDLTTEEISNTGISLLNVPFHWSQNKRVEVVVKLPGLFQELRLKCILSWRDGARTGFNFQVDEEEAEKLDKFFMHYARNQMLTIAHLRSYLKERLPYFLIPAIFVIIDALPQLPDGKINTSALKFPVSKWNNMEKEMDPRTPVEGLIHLVWETVFGIDKDHTEPPNDLAAQSDQEMKEENFLPTKIGGSETQRREPNRASKKELLEKDREARSQTGKHKISITQNFFDLGGHSLMAVELLAQISVQFNVNLPLQTLWAAPTIRDLAEIVVRKTAEQEEKDEILNILEELSQEELKNLLHQQLMED